ncbi:XRE family transcriptional regulator [Paenirhodobacter sp. CAU 1674]|uniref:helix-turn-helix domain-containing protein n=1 Tax=Paenirhodobacter sp. CAU 1674 TaxID=3032596 RepID=UPI0023DA7D6A|nr:XRE family transcriptional regulator [Paenirhodobacter sp. CAU 1674]MDF2140904.1 XRE family transcriptional regulator [Paenirhodobacter sp. CAU 1674]
MWKTIQQDIPDSLPGPAEPLALGDNLRAIRLDRGLTLTALAAQSGVSAASLSRIEGAQLSPTFDVLVKICKGLDLAIPELLNYRRMQRLSGWRSLARAGQGRVIETPQYRLEPLCDDVAAKPYLVFRATILARSLEAFEALQSHPGQEQIVVQSGRVRVHTEHYAPVDLGPGDSFAFDSAMGHALISLSDAPAEVLWVCDLHETP